MFSGSMHDIDGIAWLAAIGILLGLIAAREFGYWMYRRKVRGGSPGREDGFTLTSVLGLLALLVSFTFSMSLSRYDTRRELVVAEANAIGTTSLRVQLLDANARNELNPILHAYVAERIVYGSASSEQEQDASYARASILQNRFWQAMSRDIEPIRTTPLASLVISATNDMFDLAASRKAARAAHIPTRVLVVLLIYSMFVAFLVGYEKGHARWASTMLFVLLLIAAALILDIDQPVRGAVQVSQQPMLDAQAAMGPSGG
jgi:hypothetical protein